MSNQNEQTYESFLENEIVANKSLRKDLDEKLQELCSLGRSRERSLAITKLEECIMWIEKDTQRLGR